MVHTLADDFSQEVARLCRVEVTPSQWETLLDAHIPRVHAATGLPRTGRVDGSRRGGFAGIAASGAECLTRRGGAATRAACQRW